VYAHISILPCAYLFYVLISMVCGFDRDFFFFF